MGACKNILAVVLTWVLEDLAMLNGGVCVGGGGGAQKVLSSLER